MSAPPEAQGEPITDRRQLVEYLEAGCKPKTDWRIGTEHEKFGYTHDDLRPLPYEGERSVRALLEGLAARFGWRADARAGPPDRAAASGGASVTLEPGGQFELSGAPVKTLHETCSRGARASRPGANGRRAARHRHARARLPAQMAARRHPLDAQGPLSHHARLHAQEGQSRPRHDAAHLHHPGQSRLRVRGRHGAQVPGRPGAAAGRHGDVRQLAVHRGQAERLPQLSQPHLDRHRSRSLRHAAVRVRGRHGLRALCRLRARRADVLRLPRRPLHRRERPELSRLPRRPAAGAAGRACRPSPTGTTT